MRCRRRVKKSVTALKKYEHHFVFSKQKKYFCINNNKMSKKKRMTDMRESLSNCNFHVNEPYCNTSGNTGKKKKVKKNSIEVPEGTTEVVLHACCAPCSSAIVEWLLAHHIRPTIFYYNPNIYPLEEYTIRKEESKRHAESLGIRWIDADYEHQAWREAVCGMEGEPERGRRCQECFRLRLIATARMAAQLGIREFATTLASSRWKSLEQIEKAGIAAQEAVPGTHFWAQNWRKDGLQERRNQLLKEYAFYNQQYCGCEFSMRKE